MIRSNSVLVFILITTVGCGGAEVSTYPIQSVCFSPDGKWLATGGGVLSGARGGKGELKVWEVGSWQLRESLREDFTGRVELVTFTSPSVVAAVSTKYDRTTGGNPNIGLYFRFYDAVKQEELPSMLVKETFHGAGGIGYAPSHDLLAFTGFRESGLTKTVIYDATTLKKRVEIEQSGVLRFSPDGKTLISHSMTFRGSDQPSHLFLYDTKSGKQLATVDPKYTPIYHAAFSPDSKLLAVLTPEGKLHVLQADLKEHIKTLDVGWWIPTPVFSPDSRSLVVQTGYDKCTLYDVETWKEIRSFDGKSETFSITCMAFSPDGSMLAVGSAGGPTAKDKGFLRVWDVKTGKSLAELP